MDKRTAVLALLKNYVPLDPADEQTLTTYKNFVLQHPDCLERSLACGHLTGSCWLVNPSGDSVLLTHHKKINSWFQLGGHADSDSDLLRVAMREAYEESGIELISPISQEIFDLDIHLIPARKDEPAHYHYDARFLLRAGTDKFSISEESNDLSWVKIDNLEKVTQLPSMLRMRDKWMRVASR